MAKVDRNVVEQEVSEMFEKHKTCQDVVEALLVEMGWDSNTILAAQKERERKQQAEEAKEAKQEAKKKKKESPSPQALIQQLAEEQKAEQVEDEKSPLLSYAGEEEEVETEEESESPDEESVTDAEVEDELADDEVLAEYEEIER